MKPLNRFTLQHMGNGFIWQANTLQDKIFAKAFQFRHYTDFYYLFSK